jgi:hypothetical protein
VFHAFAEHGWIGAFGIFNSLVAIADSRTTATGRSSRTANRKAKQIAPVHGRHNRSTLSKDSSAKAAWVSAFRLE